MPKVQEISGTLFVSIPSEIAKLLAIRQGDFLFAKHDGDKLVYYKAPEPPSWGSVWRMVAIE